MREWLTVIIVILIMGILLDGFRRMRAHRKETIRLSSSMSDIDPLLDDQDAPSGEFPKGGARVVSYREETDASHIHQNMKESYTASIQTRGAAQRVSESRGAQTAPQSPTQHSDKNVGAQRPVEPSIGDLGGIPSDEGGPSVSEPWPAHSPAADNKTPASGAAWPGTTAAPGSPHDEFQNPSSVPAARQGALHTTPARQHNSATENPVHEYAEAPVGRASTAKAKPPAALPDEVLVMNVMAPKGEVFVGEEVLRSILNVGFRFGEMDIFHRHEEDDGSGKVLFSLANMIQPGTFDLNHMSSFETPGLSMFLTLPISSDSLAAFKLMATAAQTVAKDLGGELKDENRSVMTRQTIEHSRHRVLEYERKRRLAKV